MPDPALLLLEAAAERAQRRAQERVERAERRREEALEEERSAALSLTANASRLRRAAVLAAVVFSADQQAEAAVNRVNTSRPRQSRRPSGNVLLRLTFNMEGVPMPIRAQLADLIGQRIMLEISRWPVNPSTALVRSGSAWPVATGLSRSSFDYRVKQGGSVIEITNNRSYAKYLEYGRNLNGGRRPLGKLVSGINDWTARPRGDAGEVISRVGTRVR